MVQVAPPQPSAITERINLDKILTPSEVTGTWIIAVAGAISTLTISFLLLHMVIVAICTPLHNLRHGKAVTHERIFLATRIGFYISCLMVSGLFGGVASLLELIWAAQARVPNNGATCSLQGIFIQLGDVGTAVFSTLIAFHTLNTLVLKKRLPTSAVMATIALGWILTVALATVGFFALPSFYQGVGIWCFISDNHPFAQFFFHYLPMFLAALIVTVLYGVIYFSLRGNLVVAADLSLTLKRRRADLSKDEYQMYLRVLARKMFWYPVTYVILITPISIFRMLTFAGVKFSDSFQIFAAVCISLMGFANAVIYAITRKFGPTIPWKSPNGTPDQTTQSMGSFAALEKQPSIQSITRPRSQEWQHPPTSRPGLDVSPSRPISQATTVRTHRRGTSSRSTGRGHSRHGSTTESVYSRDSQSGPRAIGSISSLKEGYHQPRPNHSSGGTDLTLVVPIEEEPKGYAPNLKILVPPMSPPRAYIVTNDQPDYSFGGLAPPPVRQVFNQGFISREIPASLRPATPTSARPSIVRQDSLQSFRSAGGSEYGDIPIALRPGTPGSARPPVQRHDSVSSIYPSLPTNSYSTSIAPAMPSIPFRRGSPAESFVLGSQTQPVETVGWKEQLRQAEYGVPARVGTPSSLIPGRPSIASPAIPSPALDFRATPTPNLIRQERPRSRSIGAADIPRLRQDIEMEKRVSKYPDVTVRQGAMRRPSLSEAEFNARQTGQSPMPFKPGYV